MQLPGAKTPVSPKVISGANWSGYATLILTLLSYVTPDSLAFLGHMAPLVYGLVIGATYTLGAYLKADPLRDAGAAATEVLPAIVTNVVPADVPTLTATVAADAPAEAAK